MESLEKIEKEILNCKRCSLHKGITHYVPGEGSAKAKIMFVGEGPGFNEDRTGKPFCGASGKVLDELLDSVRIERKNAYITSILKCRPPKNRGPKKEEIEACSPYLDRQIAVIKPKIICPLGNYSTRYIFEKYKLKDKIEGISKIRSKVFEVKGLSENIKIIPLYHPAVATYNINMKSVLKRDFKILEKFK